MALKITEQSAESIGLLKSVINSSLVSDKANKDEAEAFAACFGKQEHLNRIKELKEIIHENNNH